MRGQGVTMMARMRIPMFAMKLQQILGTGQSGRIIIGATSHHMMRTISTTLFRLLLLLLLLHIIIITIISSTIISTIVTTTILVVGMSRCIVVSAASVAVDQEQIIAQGRISASRSGEAPAEELVEERALFVTILVRGGRR
jgi:hypothetical protein